MMKIFYVHTAQYKNGFVALFATIIISLVLTLGVIEQSRSAFLVREEILNRELKKTSHFLAYSCVQKAMLNLVEDFAYVPQNGGDIIQVGSDYCTIVSAVHGQEDQYSHKKLVTIGAKAERGGAYSSSIAQIEIVNSLLAPETPPIIVSYKEVPTLP